MDHNSSHTVSDAQTTLDRAQSTHNRAVVSVLGKTAAVSLQKLQRFLLTIMQIFWTFRRQLCLLFLR